MPAMKIISAALFLALAIEVLANRLHPRMVPAQIILLLCLGAATLGLAAWVGRKKRAALLAGSLGVLILLVSRLVPSRIVGNPGCENHAHSLCTCIDEYYSIHKKYPEKLSQLVPEVVQTLPTCPVSPQGFAYTMHQNPDNYTVTCVGPHLSGLNSYNSGWVFGAGSGFVVVP